MSEKEKERVSRYREMTMRYGDPWIWGIYLTLVVLSIVESYSASSRDVALMGVYEPIIKQVMYLVIGGVFVIILSRINYNNKILLLVLIPLLWIFTMVALIYVLVAGEVVNGAQRAFTIPIINLSVQPSELAKLSAVTALAYIMAKNQGDRDVSTMGVTISAALVAAFGAFMINSGGWRPHQETDCRVGYLCRCRRLVLGLERPQRQARGEYASGYCHSREQS